MVSVNMHGTPLPESPDDVDSESNKPLMSAVEVELKAVGYFQDKLLKKGPVMPVKSLAGHLSQAPLHMRNVVGPQTEFRNFLVKHKDIFVVTEDEMVTLTEDILNKPRSQATMNRSESDSSLDSNTASKSVSKDSKSKPSPITMTASEYKTMKFLKELVERNEGRISLVGVLSQVPDAADSIRNILSDSEAKLTSFVQKFPNIFVLVDDMVTLKKTKLNVIMAGSRPVTSPSNSVTDSSLSPPSDSHSESYNTSTSSNMTDSLERPSLSSQSSGYSHSSYSTHRTLSNHKGPVYHLAKLWGIIDLGRHEHVFFDRSILPDGYDDLVKNFKIGQILRFNAVRAARGSRARWRATHIWRDGEDIRSMYGMNATFSITGFNPSGVDDEMKKLLSQANANLNTNSNVTNDSYSYVDASQSNTGCIPVWTTKPKADSDESSRRSLASLSMVPDSSYSLKSSNQDGKSLIPGYMLVPTANAKLFKSCTNGTNQITREIGCQTISTGDIMATQLYQEED